MKVEKQLKNNKYNVFRFIKYISEKEQNDNIIAFIDEEYDISKINEIMQKQIEFHTMFENLKFYIWTELYKEKLKKSIVFVKVHNINEQIKRKIKILRKYSKEIVIEFGSSVKIENVRKFANTINKNIIVGYTNYDTQDLKHIIMLLGKNFEYTKKDNKKILAIIHAYNEEDVIKETLEYLVNQGIDVYVLDNWSTDKTYEKIQEIQKKYPNNITLKKYPEEKPEGNNYNWTSQLQETERISKTLDYDWFIHYDADEIRISPFQNITLAEMISFVDNLGYNAIDTTVIDFRLTSKEEKIFNENAYFEIGRRPTCFMQTKVWKKCNDVDLASTGGHLAKFENQKVYPLKIINKHYPLRSLEQAKRKVFKDRLPRFEKEKKEKGWHAHYDKIAETKDFIYDKENLNKYNEKTLEKLTLELVAGIGIDKI